MALGNSLAALMTAADTGKIIGLQDAIERTIKENVLQPKMPYYGYEGGPLMMTASDIPRSDTINIIKSGIS
jgi:hypothetical protein